MYRITVTESRYVVAVYYNANREEGIEQARMIHGDHVAITAVRSGRPLIGWSVD